MQFEDPWHLTVVRTRGLTFVRPEKSWRPIVTISVLDGNRDQSMSHEVVLGSDGQNPNLKKSVIPVHDVSYSTRLIIQVFHRSQTKKKHRKRSLVGSASLSLNEFLNKHPLPHPRPIEYDVRLSCPPPQRKNPTIGGRQQHSATLTMKFAVPHKEPGMYESPPFTPISEHPETSDGVFSDGASSTKASENINLEEKEPERNRGLRRRKRRKVRSYMSDDDYYDDEAGYSGSSCSESPAPPTPQDEYFPPIPDDEDSGYGGTCGDDESEVVFWPRILPMQVDQMSVVSVQASFSFAEACLDRYAPYHELREADEEGDCEKAEKVLGRLLTEWYVVGASLLALAGIDAAVFGFGSDSLFTVAGISRRVVSIGGISAAIGLVCDAWFLVLYSGANAQKFLRLAKDVYGSYFFFCLTCRLPSVCMLISALALMAFLFAAAWTASPTAVLVMSFIAGFLLTSQFLVFGIHRFINLLIWVVRTCWRKLAGPVVPVQEPVAVAVASEQTWQHSHPQSQSQSQSREDGDGEVRMEMPVPSPSPAPSKSVPAVPRLEMNWAAEHRRSSDGPS
ncbi:hypothetical protein C8Q74DRAFT_499009 [Fomes fomentarius]|nr:hypothetical protein C8Q74DRAFT_499009 [Fomes fomentarius]